MSRLGKHACRWAVWLIVTLVVLGLESPAGAHTGFESSDPADAEMVEAPIADIEVVFSGEVAPVGEGFVVLDGNGVIRAPDEVATSDGRSWTLRFDEPLRSGPVGVRWTVKAADNHRLTGSFSFSVDTPAPLDPTPAPTRRAVEAPALEPTPAPTRRAVEAPSIEPTPSLEPAPAPTRRAWATPTPNPTDVAVEPTARGAQPPTSGGASTLPATSENEGEKHALDDFLNDSPGPPARTQMLSRIANLLSLLGAILALGAVAFIAWVVPDPVQTPARVDALSLRSGVMLAASAIIGFVALVATTGDAWSALWTGTALGESLRSGPGVSWLLRLIAGLLFVNAFRPRARTVQARTRRATIATGAGAACILASFALDGHTASEGPRWLHSIANVVHVAAAATWAGGLAMVTATLRHRGTERPRVEPAHLAVRFSVLASVAVVAVAVPGIGLALIILDQAGDLLTTDWGRILIAKIVVVAVAGGIGAYNHKVVVPALAPGPAQSEAGTLRKTAVVETTLLLTVGAITALLVTASTVN